MFRDREPRAPVVASPFPTARAVRSFAPLALLLSASLAGGCRSAGPPPPAPPPPLLVEITAAAGLAEPAAAPWPDGTYFLPEIMGPGVGLVDHDGDGDLDIVQLRVPPPGRAGDPAPNRLLEQQPDGTFRDATARAGLGDPGFAQGLAVGDVDGDGDPDVYFANFGRDALYRNDGGTFREATAAAGLGDDAWSSAATFCDYDADGDLDLYVTHYLRLDHRGSCRAASGTPDYCGPDAYAGEPDTLWRNDGGGRFTDVTAGAGLVPPERGRRAKGLGVVCLDLTGDGRADFYVANDGESNQLWVNRGDGTFADEATVRGVAVNRHGRAEASMGIAVGDVDGDGRLDLLLTHLALEHNTLYLGGDPVYTDHTLESGLSEHDLLDTGFGCGLFDLDHDGDLDLAVVNGEVRGVKIEPAARVEGFWQRYAERNRLFENLGGGRFRDAGEASAELGSRVEVSRGLALGDLDGDGDLDLVQSNVDGSLRVYRNDAPRPGSHWLLVRALDGRRDALGARVTVSAGATRRTAAVLAGQGYQSSSDPRVHFGLGPAAAIEAIEIEWPGGSRERFRADGVDREVLLRRGEGEPL